MTSLRNVSYWRRRLGFLPVPLFGKAGERRFVLLNGSKGNFCLDIGEEPNESARRDIAWSSDVDHYISIDDRVRIQRWDQSTPESLRIEDVDSQLDKFQSYLESRSLPRERSIVSHAIKIYRTLRARADPRADGFSGLRAYLALLARAATQQKASIGIGANWTDAQISDDALSGIVGKVDLENLLDLLLNGSIDGNRPNIELMIRHAAGRIFQEAHYLASVHSQLDLFSPAQARPTGRSTALGAFFTPTPLVRTVVEQALAALPVSQLPTIRIFDPACGSGEFLREAVRQLEILRYPGRVTVIGFDVSPAACTMARFLLAAEKGKWQARLEYEVELRDSLDGNRWPMDIHCCLMNPPFVSWRGMSASQKTAVKTALNELSAMRPDMASAFLVLAEKTLAKDGVLGAVLPASMLDGDSAAPVRAYLDDRIQFRMLARLGSQQIFADALVDPGLVVASVRKTKPTSPLSIPTTLVWADHIPDSSEKALRILRKAENQLVIGPIENSPHYSVYVVPELKKVLDNWAPRPYAAVQLLQKLERCPRVGDLFSVQQGTLTGLNSVFLLSPAELQSLPKAERSYFRPAILNDSISDGRIRRGSWVFYPYGNDLKPIKTERDLATNVPRYLERWLKPSKKLLQERSGGGKDGWWGLTRHRAWQIPCRAKIVSTYFGGAGSFAWDESGEFVVVQGYGWVPQQDDFDDVAALCLLAFLTSSQTNTLLSSVSNNLSGGQWNLSKRFIERMPLPNISGLSEDAKQHLWEFGRAIHAGQLFDKKTLDAVVTTILDLQSPY